MGDENVENAQQDSISQLEEVNRLITPEIAISSSDTSSVEGMASPPHNKRPRQSFQHSQYSGMQTEYNDPRIDSLMSQVSYITQYLEARSQNTRSNRTTIETPSTFLKDPSPSSTLSLNLGDLKTDFDENKIVPPANEERLKDLIRLQQFGTPAWMGIRYKKPLRTVIATPGFTALRVNEQLCHLSPDKDYLASTEQVLAGLSNTVLEQRQMIQTGLQDLLNWASKNPQELTPSNLCNQMTKAFGPGSPTYKNSELTMQIICGKRAECIEVRRDQILKQITNTNLKATLKNVPPCSEYLFGREALLPIINSLGGTHVWLNTPTYVKQASTSGTSHAHKPQSKLISKKKYDHNKEGWSVNYSNSMDKKQVTHKTNHKKNQPLLRYNRTNQQPDFNSDRKSWSRLNKFQTTHGKSNHHLHKGGSRVSPQCDCGAPDQTLSHVVNECPLRCFPGDIAERHEFTPATAKWLGQLDLEI